MISSAALGKLNCTVSLGGAEEQLIHTDVGAALFQKGSHMTLKLRPPHPHKKKAAEFIGKNKYLLHTDKVCECKTNSVIAVLGLSSINDFNKINMIIQQISNAIC